MLSTKRNFRIEFDILIANTEGLTPTPACVHVHAQYNSGKTKKFRLQFNYCKRCLSNILIKISIKKSTYHVITLIKEYDLLIKRLIFVANGLI